MSVKSGVAALQSDTRTANLDIAVASADGHVVMLQGLVASYKDRSAVMTVATTVDGVTWIDSRVVVPGEE